MTVKGPPPGMTAVDKVHALLNPRNVVIVGSAIAYDATGEGLDASVLETAAATAHEGCSFSTLLRDAGAAVEVARIAR